MKNSQKGDKVKVHYTGKLEDGSVFDSSKEDSPLEFEIGDGKVHNSIDVAVVGMQAGEVKTIEIAPEDGFGERRDDLVVEITRDILPQDIRPEVGQQLMMKRPDGDSFDVLVTDMTPETITIDANHPLAGYKLFFDLELVEIQ